MQHMKTTRERLLTLFDRPGWGARTLRGFRDGVSSRGFDDVPIGKEREPSRTQRREVVNQSRSPQGASDTARWVPDARPKGKRDSRIRDKIRFFDGRMDFPSYGYQGPWKANGADGAVPSQSPTKYRPIVSPAKPGLYSDFPPNHHNGTLTPIKSYGYLRPKEITPLPWRPLDFRRWETVANLTSSPETPNVRGRPRERVQHSLVTPTPTNAISAVKKVQITYQDPKRNISEKVSVLCATRSNERDQEGFRCEIQENGPRTALAPFTQALSSRKTAKKQAVNDEIPVETRGALVSNEAKSVERSKTAKESKVQDRIYLFSKEGADGKGLGVPLTRMRNQSTPSKLPSQAGYGAATETSNRAPQSNRSARPQVTRRSTEVIEVTATSTVASDVLLGTVADQQWSKLQTQELASQASVPRKSSGIRDKIQQFEAFGSGRADSIGRAAVGSGRKWSSPQSKRIQSWPIPAGENVFHRKLEQTEVPEKLAEKQRIRQEFGRVINPAIFSSTETEKDNVIKRQQDRERARYKIHSRQERLNRRSRSRFRCAPSISISGLSDLRESEREAFKQLSEYFRGKTSKAKEEARKDVEMELEIALDTDNHAQRSGHEAVQEIWIDGSEDGPSNGVVVVDTIVAQCELAEPRPMRLAETLRMIRLCRGRFGERDGTWRRKMGRSSEKGGGLAA